MDLRVALLLLVGLSACGTPEPPPPPPRPNLLLISIDTLRSDHLDLYGYERQTAPALARFAADSIVFDQAYSNAPTTAPSHMTVMTGLLPETHGVMNIGRDRRYRRLSSDITTLAEILTDAGYATRAFTGGGQVVPTVGFKRGFRVFRAKRGQSFHFGRKFLSQHIGSTQPFFLFIHAYGPHGPYTPSEDYRTFVSPGYDGKIVSNLTELKQLAGPRGRRQRDEFWAGVDPEQPADLQHLRDLYDGSILETDYRFAATWEHLKQLELLDDTLVIVMSDHGEQFHEHGGFGHEALYEELLRVPLVMRFPGEDGHRWAGRRIPEVTRLVDVLPTILDYLELPRPEVLQGASLLPFLGGQSEPPRVVFSHYPRRGHLSLIRDDWKIIRFPDGREELYNLAEDPAETEDLLSSQPAEAERLRRELGRMSGANRALHEHFQAGEESEISDELREDLEALGYLGGDG